MLNFAGIALNSILWLSLGSLLVVGLVSFRRIVRRDGDASLQRRLSAPMLAMAIGGLSIASICGLVQICQATQGLLMFFTVREFDPVSCVETPLTDKYKITIEQRLDGKQEASLTDAKGIVEVIWLERYAVTGNYLTGVTGGDYFWLDQGTGGRRIFDKKDDFLASLDKFGVSQPAEFLPADEICKTRDCRPCVKVTPSP